MFASCSLVLYVSVFLETVLKQLDELHPALFEVYTYFNIVQFSSFLLKVVLCLN